HFEHGYCNYEFHFNRYNFHLSEKAITKERMIEQMNKRKTFSIMIFVIVFTLLFPVNSFAKEKKQEQEKGEYDIPNHVLTISKENTFPNSTEDQEVVEPSELARELIEEVDT